MAEDLSEYLKERKIKATYLHSDIKTIERIEILTNFRRGEFDVLVYVANWPSKRALAWKSLLRARAIENQCYVVIAGNVGNLPGVNNMNVQYAQSCILTPCDFPFARDGIAAETTENVETIAVADLDLSDLDWARRNGTVRNLRDRRFDLYRLVWRDDAKK